MSAPYTLLDLALAEEAVAAAVVAGDLSAAQSAIGRQEEIRDSLAAAGVDLRAAKLRHIHRVQSESLLEAVMHLDDEDIN
jgi:hypothetical protein